MLTTLLHRRLIAGSLLCVAGLAPPSPAAADGAWPVAPPLVAGPLVAGPARSAPTAPGPAADGTGRFFKTQGDLARQAIRAGDHAAAEQAWLAVLELDPRNMTALEGLVDVAARSEAKDLEALYLRELQQVQAARVASGDRQMIRPLQESTLRRSQIDPFAGDAEALVAEHGQAMAALGAAYLEAGLHANALVCWSRRLGSTAEGSPERAEATQAINRCLTEGGDYVSGLNIAPELEDSGRDAEWIAEFDAKTSKFSRAGEWQTPHYRIKVAGNWRLGEATAKVMEQVADFYRDVWGLIPDPAPKDPDPALRDVRITPILVSIYRTHEEYLKRTGSPEWSGGVFMGSEVATYDHGSGGRSWRATLETLYHEASHQFMSEAVGAVPSFVNEGIACQFESIEILPNGTIRRDAPNKQYLQSLVDTLKSDPTFTLATVMDPVNGNAPEFYAPRWGLFHFLRMYVDDQGAYVYRDKLTEYIYDFKRGSVGDTTAHFEAFFIEPFDVAGIEDFAGFEQVWREWILDLDRALQGRDSRLEEYRRRGRIEGLKREYETSLRFWTRAFELEPDAEDVLAGMSDAAAALDNVDLALWTARRWLELAPEDASDRARFLQRVNTLDERARERADATRELVGGMAGLALRYDEAGMPLMAMRVAHDVLEIDPWDAAARALVSRLERETGRSVIRWQRLFNQVDLDGWFAADGAEAFHVADGVLTADYSRVDVGRGAGAGVSLYQALFAERSFAGDWTVEVRIQTRDDWEIAGLCFGARDADNFEGVVLRKGDDGMNRVDFGSFDGSWSFRGDGSYKADYDPAGPDGTLLRVQVRNREVSVTLDGEPLALVVDGKPATSIRYPVTALQGDGGLLASKGVTRFTDLRLLAGRIR